MRTIKNPVFIDKYALHNACLANETTIAECSVALGRASNYLAQNFRKGRAISMGDYEQLKGMLKITDDSLIKAVPVNRADGSANIYSPRPAKKTDGKQFTLTDKNAGFIDLLAFISGCDKEKIVNGIISEYCADSELSKAVQSTVDIIQIIAS